MKQPLLKSLMALTAVCATSAFADTITLWDFNGDPGTLSPSVGAGTAGGVGANQTFYGGAGSSDPATGSIDRALGLNGFPVVASGNKTAGAEFKVSTEGFVDISIAYEIQRSGSASKWERFQISFNGVDFVDTQAFSENTSGSFSSRIVDLSGVAGVENNPDFAFRIVSEFESTASGSGSEGYVGTTSSYTSGGTWRFDMVGVSGNSVSPVPEPTSAMLGLVGAGALAFRARRRH